MSREIGASDTGVVVKVTPCAATGWCLGAILVTVAFEWICILCLTLYLRLLGQDSGNVPGASHLLGSDYLTSGTSAITLWPVSWEPLRRDIEKLSANEILDSMSRGACSLKQSWGEFSPYCWNTLLLLLEDPKMIPWCNKSTSQAACYPSLYSKLLPSNESGFLQLWPGQGLS